MGRVASINDAGQLRNSDFLFHIFSGALALIVVAERHTRRRRPRRRRHVPAPSSIVLPALRFGLALVGPLRARTGNDARSRFLLHLWQTEVTLQALQRRNDADGQQAGNLCRSHNPIGVCQSSKGNG